MQSLCRSGHIHSKNRLLLIFQYVFQMSLGATSNLTRQPSNRYEIRFANFSNNRFTPRSIRPNILSLQKQIIAVLTNDDCQSGAIGQSRHLNNERSALVGYFIYPALLEMGNHNVMSQQTSNINADPLNASSRPPHWYSRPDSNVPMNRPAAFAA